MECLNLCTESSNVDNASAIGGILAGAAALISAAVTAVVFRITQRRYRARLFLSVRGSFEVENELEFLISNRGVVAPAILGYASVDSKGQGGGTEGIERPEPGKHSIFSMSVEEAKAGVLIEFSWTDQDGSSHTQTRWYQLDGDPSEKKNQRSDLIAPGKLLQKFFPPDPLDKKPPRDWSKAMKKSLKASRQRDGAQ